MQEKTIKAILSKKFNDFVGSIDDDEVKALVKMNTIITGGCIASMLLKEQVKDYDLYFRNFETANAVAQYYSKQFMKNNPSKNVQVLVGGKYLDKNKYYNDDDELVKYINEISDRYKNDEPMRIRLYIKSKGVALDKNQNMDEILDEPFEDVFDVLPDCDLPLYTTVDDEKEITEKMSEEKTPYRPIFISSNAITLSGKVQLITRFYGEPDEIHQNYDFVHATNYWTSWNNELVTKVEAYKSLMSKQLLYIGSKYPLCSIIRTRKFVSRGWNINAGQYLKMIFQCNELDLNDIDILEDQLVGVDSAYFMQMIDAMRNKIQKGEMTKVNFGYLVDLIDKIF